MKLTGQAQECIRIMSLDMNQLKVEARERYSCPNSGRRWNCPIMVAACCNYPLRVLKRLQVAYPGGVNAEAADGETALMGAVGERNVECVELLLEMGSCAGVCNCDEQIAFDYTNQDFADQEDEDGAKKQAIIAIFEKHGITSNVIPAKYTSPLYFESIYFTQSVVLYPSPMSW
jgi:ankyrin repeat protein